MRVKLLRDEDGATVRLVYPSTLAQYGEAFETLGALAVPAGAGGPDADGGVDVAIHGSYVVTTESQRAGWQLPDLFSSGRARVVDESKAFGLLRDAAAAARPSRRWASGPDGRLSEALRAPCAPGARLERVQTHGRVDLPGGICKTLRRELRRAIATRPAGEVVDRARHVLSLPWCRRSPARWDAAEVSQALERAHGGHGRARSRLVEALAACPQSSGLLTVEGALAGRDVAAGGAPLALVVRPAASASPVPCLAGPSGVGKTSLAVAAAAALGRPHVQVMLGGQDAWRLLHGTEDGGSGRIIAGLSEAGVNNPVFILEGIDVVDAEVAGVLLDVLDPQRRRAFDDAYIDVSFDLSAALWIVTATEPDRIPAPVRQWLRVIELSGYSVEEKVDIARRHLLTRPFAERSPSSWLSPEPPESAVEPVGCAKGPAVVSDVSVSSLWELESSRPASAPPSGVGEDWRMAACTGAVGFEPEAIRRVIEDHTNESGVSELSSKLSAICRRVVERRPPGRQGPEMVTPAVVREVLGAGETLPSAVRAAIARERQRLADGFSSAAAATKTDWIEWLERLPWTRRSSAVSDLAGIRAALNAGHAGLDEAKSRILEYLAVRRRNPRSGAVLCLLGPPGVGKTSLARCTARALGRGFLRLACGGLRDESELRGHNRTWKDSQPGWILRELRRVGSRDPVFLLDELDKIGTASAAVLLEVLDPQQHKEFRDAFVEVPFDLSEVLFITTANEVSEIPAALRDRLEVIELPGYSEDEKVSIALTHLVESENRAAGLSKRPVRFTAGALRRMIREHTSEQGVRELARCVRTVCRKVALGLETGDASLVRERITAREVRTWLGAPASDRTDGLAGLRARLAAPALPSAVRERGRQVLARLSACSPADSEHAQSREYLQCLEGVPWTARAAPTVDLACARALLDAGHASHAAVKERLLDYVAVRLSNPGVPSSLLCLLGPPGVGKTSLARLVASALGRPSAWVDCGGLRTASALHGTRWERPGTDRRGAAARRRTQSGVRARRGRPAGRGGRGSGGAARSDRPAAGRGVPRPLPGPAVRPVRGALRGDGDQSRFGAGDAAGTDADRRAARVRRDGEAGDCDPAPVAGTAAAARADDRPGRGHGRGDRGDHRRLYAGGGRVAAGRGAGRGVREGGAAAVRGGRGGGRGHAGESVRDARRAPASGVGGGGWSHRAAGGRRRAVLHGGRDRRGVGHRSEPDGRLRGTDPDRRPGGSHAGVGAGRAVVAAGQRRALRHRPGLSSSHGHPPARGCRAGRWDVGRGDDGGGAGVGDDRARGARRRGAERRGHAVRPGASGRRHRGEAAGGAPLRAVRRHPAAGEPEGGGRGGGRGAAPRGRGALRDAGRRAAGAGAGAGAVVGRAGWSGVLSCAFSLFSAEPAPACRSVSVRAGGQPAVRPAGFLIGPLTRTRASPACAATTTSGAVAVSDDGARFDHRDVGRMKMMSPSASWRLNCTRFIGCPPFRRGCRFASCCLPPTWPVGSTVVDASAPGAREPCVPAGAPFIAGQPGRKSLLDVARVRGRARRRPGRGACGFRPVRIGRVAGPRPNRETFALEGDPETAALSDFVALGRAPGRLRARLGAMVRCRSMTLARIEAARWLGWLGSAAGTNEVVGLAVEES